MPLPQTMTAIVAVRPGDPEVLTAVERPVPLPGERQLLVRVRAAGINRPDVVQRKGHYPPPPGASDILGLEVAGVVVALGPGATTFAVGDAVAGLVASGGYAEYAAIDESNALPIPPGLSFVEAAALPETFFTVWSNVFDRGHLKAGEWFLVHGGSSGIGTTAIQLGKIFGAHVIATAGSAAKCDACVKLGADAAINYREEDFVTRVAEITGKHGADLILDMVGGDYVNRNYKAAAEDGRIVQIATQQGTKAEADFALLMRKRLTHTGSTLRVRSVAFKAELAAALRKHVWPLLSDKKVTVLIDSTFPLRRAADAHARMESSAHIGKIVLTVD